MRDNNILILSDIHANLSAFKSVLSDVETREINPVGLIIAGDIINYGMRPNETIAHLARLRLPVLANIRGNHEQAVLDGDTSHFSTDRGKRALEYMRGLLSKASMEFITTEMETYGKKELTLSDKRILVIHGTIEDEYWGKFDTNHIDDRYSEYDYVIMGHSHVPMLYQHFFSSDNHLMRHKKRTVFINPGSVGQPRNHNPRAQYAVADFDNETFCFYSVDYDIEAEQALYDNNIDTFYKERLFLGI